MVGVVKGCCGLFLAFVAVPVAVIIAVMLETPVVTTLADSSAMQAAAASGKAGGGGAVPAAGPAAAAAGDFGTAGLDGMGSGRMFDRIAFVYDVTNKWMSMGLDQFWRQQLVENCMALEKDDRVLDLATGTADVSILVGKQLRQLGSVAVPEPVIGLDPSSEMLRRGVTKVQQEGLVSTVRLVKGDAQDLSEMNDIDAQGGLTPSTGLPGGSVDKISMSFGIRNVPARSKALKEMRRVLRPGPSSRVCILELSLPSGESFLSRTAREFITKVVPFIGKVATMGSGSEEYKYLEASIMKFPQPMDFAAELAQEGLKPERVTSFAFGSVHLYEASPAH